MAFVEGFVNSLPLVNDPFSGAYHGPVNFDHEDTPFIVWTILTQQGPMLHLEYLLPGHILLDGQALASMDPWALARQPVFSPSYSPPPVEEPDDFWDMPPLSPVNSVDSDDVETVDSP
jgi:hypothetical protein